MKKRRPVLTLNLAREAYPHFSELDFSLGLLGPAGSPKFAAGRRRPARGLDLALVPRAETERWEALAKAAIDELAALRGH
jgi:hypothetical protein